VASFQNTRHTTSNHHCSRSTSSMVPPGWCSYFQQTSYTPFQPLHEQLHSSTTMETGTHQTNSKTVCPLETRRFQANLHHLVLTRVMEKTAVKRFFYPAFLTPPPSLTFSDQFAFRPTGSPAAAIITLLHTITNMFVSNPYVAVICLDFSKAFDTVRHSTFMEKMAKLQIQDTAYNWMADFFSGHSHCTQYRDETSTFKCITASVVQ